MLHVSNANLDANNAQITKSVMCLKMVLLSLMIKPSHAESDAKFVILRKLAYNVKIDTF